jgi:phosphate transport system permease protein
MTNENLDSTDSASNVSDEASSSLSRSSVEAGAATGAATNATAGRGLLSPEAWASNVRNQVSLRVIPEFLLRRQRWADAIFRELTRAAALLVVLLMLALVFVLVQGSWPALKAFGWHFFTRAEWDPVLENFGALVPIYGTLVSSFLALVLAVPVAFGIAVFLTELAPQRLRSVLGTAIELLAAIPSIIYGMWGLFIFAPLLGQYVEPWMDRVLGAWPVVGALFRGPPMGIGVLSASLILALMILPFITAVMRDVFESVPHLLKESAYGLGATTWEVVSKIVLPHSKVGVMGGIMLGLGRALGETMAVTFVIGNAHEMSASLLMPGSTISSVLANEFSEASSRLYSASLIELALVLFLITFVVLALSRGLLRRLARFEGARH